MAVAVAVAAACAASGLAFVLEEAMGEPPVSLFFAAVMLSAWFGGLGPGLLTTALGGLAINYLFEEPRYSFGISSPVTPLRLALYVGAALLISWLNVQRRTALERADAARAEAERLAAIVESSVDAVIGLDPAGTIRTWNAGAERLYGYGADEVLGTSVRRLVPQDEPDILPRLVDQLRRGVRFGHFDAVRVAKDGRRIDVSVAASQVLDSAGAVTGVSLIERDVTSRREAAEVRERLAAIVRSSSDAILAKTLDGTITAWNPAAERLYGYSLDEAVGCSIEMLVPPEKRAELRSILGRVANGEAVEQLETVRMRRDARRIRVVITVAPIRGLSDEIVGASTIARPVD